MAALAADLRLALQRAVDAAVVKLDRRLDLDLALARGVELELERLVTVAVALGAAAEHRLLDNPLLATSEGGLQPWGTASPPTHLVGLQLHLHPRAARALAARAVAELVEQL